MHSICYVNEEITRKGEYKMIICKYYQKPCNNNYPAYCSGSVDSTKCQCNGDKDKCDKLLCQSKEESLLTENRTIGDWIWQGMWLTFPIYPWFNERTKQVYKRNIFREMIATNTTFMDFKNQLESYIRSRNINFGVNCSNNEFYLVRENKRFAFGIYSNEFYLWNDFGESIGSYNIDINKVPSDKFIEWIEKVTKEYCDGIIPCSDCGKSIKKTEIAGRYFSGVYCSDCWNRTWKEIEAKENYN